MIRHAYNCINGKFPTKNGILSTHNKIFNNFFDLKRENLNKNKQIRFFSEKKPQSKLNEILASTSILVESQIPKSKELFTSTIRSLNIGKNYFRYVNPRRKKILLTLMNSYIKQFEDKQIQNEIIVVLDLFYNNELNGKKFNELNPEELEFSESILWHLNSIVILDRIASQYSRFEFTEYDQIIKQLNNVSKDKRNKAKYIFTNHPNQPNSIDQLRACAEIFKSLEENDLSYMDSAMKNLSEAHVQNKFTKPSLKDEVNAYLSITIPEVIDSFSMMYELGFRDFEDFFETPGTLIGFDFSNNPKEKVGMMSYTHGLNIKHTIEQYVSIIEEADLKEEMKEILRQFDHIIFYAEKLINLHEDYSSGKINKSDFFMFVPVSNVAGIQSQIVKMLKDLEIYSDPKVSETSKKLLALMSVFGIVGCTGQIRISGSELKSEGENFDINSVDESLKDILKEISILNSNIQVAEMIIFEYDKLSQYTFLQKLIEFYGVNIELVPMMKSFDTPNQTGSSITCFSPAQSITREGLIFSELRMMKQYKNHPEKWILIGQGNTAERGGGPFGLTHQKYHALTRIQRQRHIRTIQGYYFSSEFICKDLIFTFLLNGAIYLNIVDHFEPSLDYIDFLYDLDCIVGAPLREMQKTIEFNKLYVDNPIIKTLVENFDYAGAEDVPVSFDNVKEQSPIVQAYIFSDRCSFSHPELAFWDKVDENLIKRMAKTYYDNNRHFKYILYYFGFLLKRFDLEFAKSEVGMDEKNQVFQAYLKGRDGLEKILNNIGLSTSSTPIVQIYNQHLGLLTTSSQEEANQKFEAYRMLYSLQNYYVRRYLKDLKMEKDTSENKKKFQIIQSALANISTFNGKG